MAMSGTEAPVPTVDTVEAAFPAVSFPSLCESVAEFGYVALRDLVEQLVEQRSDDVDAAEKNVLVIDVSQRERHRLLRLLTLFRWLRGSYTTLRQAQVCVIEADWLANRFERTGADVLWSMHQQLRAGPLFAAAMDVPAAATVATTGTYDRLPLVLHLAKSSAIPQLRHQAIRILGTRTCLLLREAASTMHVQLQFSPCNETEASRAFVAVSDRNMRGWRAVVGLRPVSPSTSLPPLQATSMKQAEWDWVVSKVTLDGDAANAPLAASVVQGRYVNICRKKQVVEFAEKTRYFLGCLVSCLSVELCEPLRVVSLASSIETLVKDQSDAASNGFQGRATVGTPSTIRVRRLGPHHAHFQVLYWPTPSKPSVALDLVQAENRWWHAISVQCTHLEVPPTPEWLWDPNYRLQGPLHGYVRIGHQPPLPTDASVDMAHIETGDGVGLLMQVRRARAHALLRTIASELPLSIRKQLMDPCSLDLRLPGAGDLTVHVQVEEQDGVVCVRVGADDVLTSIRNVGGYVDPLFPGWLRIETWPAWLPISEQRQRILIRLEALQRHALSDQVRVLADLCSWYPHPVYLMPGANRLELAVKLSSGSYFVPIGHVLAALAGHREESVQGSRWARIVAYTVDALRRVEYLTSLMRESGVLDEDRTPDIIPWSTAVALIRGRAERLTIPLRMRTYEGLTIHHSWLHVEAACPDRSPWSVELDIATDLFDSCTDSTAIDGESSAGRIVVESTRAPRGLEEPTPVPSAIVESPKATSSTGISDACRSSLRHRMRLRYPHATTAYIQHLAWDLKRASRMATLLHDPSLSRAQIRRTGNFFRFDLITPARLLVRLPDGIQLVITYRCHERPHGYIAAFRGLVGSLEFAIRLIEEVLNAQPCYTVLYGLLERTLPLALAAEAAFRGRQARFRFLSALRLRIVVVAQDVPSRDAAARNHVLELDAKEGAGFVRLLDIGARAPPGPGTASIVPLPGWDHVQASSAKRSESETDHRSMRVPLVQLRQTLEALISASCAASFE